MHSNRIARNYGARRRRRFNVWGPATRVLRYRVQEVTAGEFIPQHGESETSPLEREECGSPICEHDISISGQAEVQNREGISEGEEDGRTFSWTQWEM